ncbi:MAG: permease [Chloroflexi bacterium]|nr:permease [Chloroflexota bacterium]
MASHGTQRTGRTPYYLSLTAFLASLGLLLFTLVDIRRGFLFSSYFKIGAPSTLLNLNPGHLALAFIAGLGMWLSYKYMKRLEDNQEKDTDTRTMAKTSAIIIGALLVIDLFIYRGVPASRFLAAGKMGVGAGPMGLGRAMPVDSFPEWLQPAAEGLNYLLVVWHATTLGILLGSLFLVAGAGLVMRLRGNSFVTHLTGSAVSLAQPFCSCCSAPIGAALYRKGASVGPTLAFVVSAPMLNITSLILATALLPAEFALLRILGGILIGIFITYGISLLAARRLAESPEATDDKRTGWGSKVISAYTRLFQFEKLFSEAIVASPAALVSNWLGMAGRLARVMVPVLLVGAILSAYIVQAMPDTGNNFFGVGVTALFGSLIMVPTWTEIPFAAALINKGLPGMAAVALITLPAVSLPALAIVAGSMRNVRVALALGLSVFIVGTAAGALFL